MVKEAAAIKFELIYAHVEDGSRIVRIAQRLIVELKSDPPVWPHESTPQDLGNQDCQG
jgi:hypothetical protein